MWVFCVHELFFRKILWTMEHTLAKYAIAAADLLLPRTCIVCGRKLDIEESLVCLYCSADIPFTFFWQQGHNPMADRFNALIQNAMDTYPQTDDWQEVYAFAVALYFFSDDSDYRNIQYGLKYKGNIASGKHFGKMLGQRLASSVRFADVDIVIPVPLHWTRKWSRGYNQAEIIAGEVAQQLGAELRCDILTRRRRTRTQTELDAEAKKKNVKDAFAATPPGEGIGKIRHVLLIDDIFTTGATMHSCFAALRWVFPPYVRISIATLGYTG